MKALVKATASSGVLYIFQLAAISFLRMCGRAFLMFGGALTFAVGKAALLLRERGDTGQDFAFEEFEGCAAAGGDVGDARRYAGLVHCGD